MEELRSKGSYFGVKVDSAHRALILADSFYEWPKPEDKAARAELWPPVRFVLDGGQSFAFAGRWATAPNLSGGPVENCTLITRDATANRVVAPIHHRMPAILPNPEAMRAWLDTTVGPQGELGLSQPLAAERISDSIASRAVNNVNLPDSPGLLTPAQYGPSSERQPAKQQANVASPPQRALPPPSRHGAHPPPPCGIKPPRQHLSKDPSRQRRAHPGDAAHRRASGQAAAPANATSAAAGDPPRAVATSPPNASSAPRQH